MSREKKETKEKFDCWLPKYRATQSDIELLRSKAAAAGLTKSEYQRRLLHDGFVIQPKNVLEPKAVIQLSDIGNSLRVFPYISNNLNQLVRKEHIHDEADTERLEDIIKALEIETSNLSNLRMQLENIVKVLVYGS